MTTALHVAEVTEPNPPPLYANRVKVYPKAVSGLFRRIKWAVLCLCLSLYYLVPWLRWDRGPGSPDQAVLIDLPGRRAYFFMIEIWPQEIYLLTGALILAAVSLFLVTSLFGRLWCGYACPQTVWTDLFMWIERQIEGDATARMRLDAAPWSARKFALKASKHTAWLLVAFATGGAWIMYYTDAPTLLGELARFEASATTVFFIALFTATTYLLAGWAREQVCTYMCPWPRFQAAMLDEHSTIVTYQGWRGEPRGKHRQGDAWDGRGDCIDCRQCVAVCPTGIDIRDGQQLECIGCALCIDACDEIMTRVDRPVRLITWDTLANQTAKAKGAHAPHRWIRPRTLIYAGVLAVVAGALLIAVLSKSRAELSVLRDRNPLFVRLADGSVRNAFTIKILNKTREETQFRLSAPDLAAATLTVPDGASASADHGIALAAGADAVATYRVLVTLPAKDAQESLPFHFNIEGAGTRIGHETAFLGPPTPGVVR